MKELVIVTDASRQIGMGHLMRQFALARFTEQQEFSVRFVSISELVEKRCAEETVACQVFENWTAIIENVTVKQPDAVIIDVHEKEFEQFRPLAKKSFQLILMVSEIGHHFDPYGDHMVRVGSDMKQWNQTWKSETGTEIHSGRCWMIFRDEFLKVDATQKIPGRIIVAHGGTDPFQLTEFSLEAIEECKNSWSVDVLVTSQFKDQKRVDSLAKNSKHNVVVHTDSNDVARLMAAASIGIMNGGNIRYELCLTQTPFVAVSFQPTQYICTEQVTELGVGVNCGLYTDVTYHQLAECVDGLLLDKKRLSEMRNSMNELFDFNGPKRILKILSNE